jgi:hypothetical protein
MADDGHGVAITFGTSGFSATIIDSPEFDEFVREALETTHHGITDGFKTFMPGDLVDPGGWRFTIQSDPDEQPPYSGAVETITITYALPSGQSTAGTFACSGFITNWKPPSTPTGGIMTEDITIKFTGAPTFTDSAA